MIVYISLFSLSRNFCIPKTFGLLWNVCELTKINGLSNFSCRFSFLIPYIHGSYRTPCLNSSLLDIAKSEVAPPNECPEIVTFSTSRRPFKSSNLNSISGLEETLSKTLLGTFPSFSCFKRSNVLQTSSAL